MAPRANWKGFLRLSLVTCPVALYPATSDSEKISFNQLNRNTGHRIKYMKVDADKLRARIALPEESVLFAEAKNNGQPSDGLMLVYLVELDGGETDEQPVDPGAFPPART
jgi:Ku70/Ku80 beta-barrel domain